MKTNYSLFDYKIAILTPELADRCGICRAVSTLSFALSENQSIFTNKFDSRSQSIKSGWKITVATSRIHFLDLFSSLKTLFLLRKSFSGDEIIINTHSYTSHIIAASYKLLFNKKAKVLALVYDMENLRVKSSLDLVFFLLFRVFIKLGGVDKILVLDERMKAMANSALGVTNINVLRLGIHPNLLTEQYLPMAYHNEFVLYFHGKMIPRRKLEIVLTAIGMIENDVEKSIHFVISGEIRNEHYFNYLRKKSQQLKSKVSFIGSITDDDLIKNYNNCDIFVWPCSPQTWGLAPLEAMYFGKPVIVSLGSGVSEVLNDQVAILVPPDSPDDFAKAILSLISNDELRTRLGISARALISEEYTFRNTGIEFKRIIEEV